MHCGLGSVGEGRELQCAVLAALTHCAVRTAVSVIHHTSLETDGVPYAQQQREYRHDAIGRLNWASRAHQRGLPLVMVTAPGWDFLAQPPHQRTSPSEWKPCDRSLIAQSCVHT